MHCGCLELRHAGLLAKRYVDNGNWVKTALSKALSSTSQRSFQIERQRWTSVLEQHGFNDGHVHAGDLQELKPGGLAAFMAPDAKHMCERLWLLAPEGLTEAGRRVAAAAAVPIRERPSDAERAAAAVVGEQIRRHYVGADGLELAPLVQQASAQIAAAEQPRWADVRGLVLAELDSRCSRSSTSKNPGCVAMIASNTHANALNHRLTDLAR